MGVKVLGKEDLDEEMWYKGRWIIEDDGDLKDKSRF